jgi:adenosine kinase
MKIAITGSIAYDYLMTFPGRFRDHILPDRLERLSLSFLTEDLVRRQGGNAANIAYTHAMLGGEPTIMATAGQDFEEYGAWLEGRGIDTSGIRVIPELFTASFFATTDESNAQIASFYAGAMSRANELRFSDLNAKPELALISPNDPLAMSAHVEECQQLGIPYFYDPSQQIVRLDPEALHAGIEGCAGLFGNDYEIRLLEEKTGLDMSAIRAQDKLLVVTLGEDGVNILHGDMVLHIPAISARQAGDPTGVGDAFRGGFLRGYELDFGLERCGQMGVLAATYCLECDGPQAHCFELGEYISRFREHFDDQGDLDRLQ